MNPLRYLAGFLLLSCVLLAQQPPAQETFTGKVIRITDGDTITVKVGSQLLITRLEGIDAPERGQAFGTRSKEALAKLVAEKEVTVTKTGVDKYRRTLGIIHVDDTNVNAKMVQDGWAWHFKKYSNDAQLAKLETEAREAKRGLWADKDPIPPWDYRDRPATADTPKPVMPVPKPKAEPKLPEAKPAETKPEKKYWLNSSSGVRHNQGCKHFGSTKKGRPCGPDEGKACGICGG